MISNEDFSNDDTPVTFEQRIVTHQRTQINFIGENNIGYLVSIPAWPVNTLAYVSKDKIPAEMQAIVSLKGFRCHAYVNLDAKNSYELDISGWEF